MIGFIVTLAVMVIPINCGFESFKRHHSNWGYKVNDHESVKEHHWAWGYKVNGPETWSTKQKTCGGSSQSPINIITDSEQPCHGNNRLLSHNNYDEEPNAKHYMLVNNGHTLKMKLPKTTKYVLTKNNIKYIPLQVHIHFNPITGKGSEHTVDSKQYFAEIHIVHKRSGITHLSKPGDLLVVGIFADRVENCRLNASFAMKLFAITASHLKQKGNSFSIPAFPLSKLLPHHRIRNAKVMYVNYSGSLTTPPCSEVVDWVVITGKRLIITHHFANMLKAVHSGEYGAMAGNNRPTQPLNGRKLYCFR